MSRKAKLILAFIAAVTASAIVAAFLTAAFLRQRAMMSRFSESDKLTQLEKLIGSFYIDDYDEGALEDAAAEAMIEALDDPWSYYVPAAEAEALNEQMNNGYQGVGITVEVDDGQCVVLAVQKDSPAQAADIRVGDILTTVDGTDVTGWTVDEIETLSNLSYRVLLDALVSRGVDESHLSVERNDMLYDGRKFAGGEKALRCGVYSEDLVITTHYVPEKEVFDRLTGKYAKARNITGICEEFPSLSAEKLAAAMSEGFKAFQLSLF